MTQHFSLQVSDKALYRQLLFYQQLFDVSKASDRHGKSFNSDLVGVPGGQGNYAALKGYMDEVMNRNGYSVIDLSKIFAGFGVTKAAKFRKARNM